MAINFLNNPKVGDNVKIEVGDSSDLQIYHDGSISKIIESTGELQISSSGSNLYIQSVTGENAIKLIPNSSVELYYDNAKKFETTSTGATVSGDLLLEEANTPTLSLKDTTNNLVARFRAANSYAYITVDHADTVGSSRLVFQVDNTTSLYLDHQSNAVFEGGKVGIGETSIDANLHITTATAGLVNQKFESAGSAAWRLGIPASQTYFAFANTNDNLSAPKLIIDSSGNVGIGTSSPASKLDVAGSILISTTTGTPASGTNGLIIDHAAVIGGGANSRFYSRGDASERGGFQFNQLKNDNTGSRSVFSIDKDGKAALNQYGSGSITGTAAYSLQVDSSGNIIEGAASGGGTITGSGTATRLAFWVNNNSNGVSTELSSDSNLYWDNTNDRLGIGTTSPDVKLHTVGGNVTGAFYDGSSVGVFESGNPYVQIIGTDAGNQASSLMLTTVPAAGTGNNKHWTLQHRGTTQSGNFGISYDTTSASGQDGADGTDKFVIDTSGNVGIGTTSPSQKLNVVGITKIEYNGVGLDIENTATSGADTGIRIRGARNGQSFATGNLTSYALFSNYDDNTTPNSYDLAKIGAGMYDANADTGYFRIMTNNGTAMTKALDIDKSQNALFYGNIGVGTDNPTSRLVLVGAAAADSTLAIANTTSNAFWQIQASSAANNLLLIGGGNVGIGTTNPLGTLNVNKENAESVVLISRGGSNPTTSTDIGKIKFSADYSGQPTEYGNIKAYANSLSAVRGSIDFNVKSTSGSVLTGMTVQGTSSGVNVGIGTTSPTTKLSVDGGESTFNRGNSAGNIATFRGQNAAKAVIGTATSYFTSNVGIGTTSPIGKFNIQQSSINVPSLFIGRYNSENIPLLQIGESTDFSPSTSYGMTLIHSSNRDIVISTASDQSFTDVDTAAVTIKLGNGNVGIGTSSPTYGKLVISSSIASSSTYNWLVFDNQASGYGDWNIYKSGNNNLAFGYGVSAGNSYSNAFILEYGGNVGIGNTSPDKKLHVNSGSTSDIVKFENNNGSMVFGQTTALTSLDLASSNAYRIRQGSSTPFKIETSGAVTFGGVISAAGGNAAAPSIIFEGNTDTGFFHPATDEIGFSTAGSERMRIDNGGNVGIGTTAPDGKLTISGGGTSTAPTISVINTSSTAFNHSINAFTPNMTSTESNILVFGKAGSAKNSAYIGYRYSGTAGSNDNLLILGHWASDNLMTITGDGKVGIGTGTTSPTVKLAVEENVNASASILVNNPNSGTGARSNLILTSDAARIDMYATSSTYNGVASWTDAGVINTASSTSGGLILNAQAGGIKFQQGTSEKMRIDSNGDVGIGTTNPVPKLHLVYPNGSYGVDATSGFINQASSGRSTTRLRSIADEASELFFDINGAIRWDISARPSTQGHSLNFYPAASTPAYNNVAAHSLQLSQNGDVIVTGSGSSGNMGIGTTAPGERLEVDGLIKSRKGIYTHKGIATGGGTNTNKWQKFATASYSSFSYSAFKLLIQIKGDTSNVNTNAEVDISYKFQNNNGRIYANITNYGSYPLTSSNFEIYRNGTSTSGTLSFYIYINKNYSEPVYSVIGTGNLIFSSSVIGTSLSGETNDAWTTKNISNTLTIDADSGYVGIGTTAPAVTLDVAGVVRSTNLSTKYAQLESNSSGGVVKGVGGNGFLVRSYGDSYFNGGDFGIGTTSPDEKLHIASSNKTKDGILEGTNNILLEDSNATGSSVGEPIGGILFKQNDQTTAAGVTAFMGAMHASSDGDANLTFATGTAGSEPQPRMTVRYDGNVGIGVGDPNNRLDIDSSSTNSVHIQGTGSYNLYSYHDSGGVGWATGSGTSYTNLLYMNANNNSMSFYTGSSVKMSITNGIVNNISGTGFVGIGTTSPAVVNGTTFGGAMLHVKGPSNIGRLVLEGNVQGTMLMNASGSTANKRLKFMQAKSVNGSSGGDAEFRMGKVTDSGTETTQLSIPDSGDVKVNTAGKGIVLVSPDGTTTVRVSINNSGELVLTEI